MHKIVLIFFYSILFQQLLYGNEGFREINMSLEKSKIPDPLSLRDPFNAPILVAPVDIDEQQGFLKDGVFTNIRTVGELEVGSLEISGVVIGKERRALAKSKTGETIILKEGMLLGKDNAEIKAILPGGIILVEKIINVYGQEEYLETVIPVNKGIARK